MRRSVFHNIAEHPHARSSTCYTKAATQTTRMSGHLLNGRPRRSGGEQLDERQGAGLGSMRWRTLLLGRM
jgi:hypothetical protein